MPLYMTLEFTVYVIIPTIFTITTPTHILTTNNSHSPLNILSPSISLPTISHIPLSNIISLILPLLIIPPLHSLINNTPIIIIHNIINHPILLNNILPPHIHNLCNSNCSTSTTHQYLHLSYLCLSPLLPHSPILTSYFSLFIYTHYHPLLFLSRKNSTIFNHPHSPHPLNSSISFIYHSLLSYD
jgi:hypothetical protein